MKKLIWMIVLALGCATMMAAGTNPVTDKPRCEQQKRLTPQEFRTRQQEFITENARLTPQEAAKFFPLYFELQDRKKQLNDEAWQQIRKGKNKDLSEKEYDEILSAMYDARIAADRLDKTYYDRFKKILPCSKLYQVQRAEMRFHRELVKGMHRKNRQAEQQGKGKL